MSDALVITAPGTLSNPMPGNPKLPIRGDFATVTSDGFSGTGRFPGRMTDVALGGSPLPWTASLAAALKVDGGHLTADTPSGSFFTYVAPSGFPDGEVLMEFTVRALPVGASTLVWYIDLFRDSASTTSSKLRAVVYPSGVIKVGDNPAGASWVAFPGAEVPAVAIGDRIGIQYNNRSGKLSLYRNGTQVHTSTPGVKYAGNMFGFAGAADVAGARFDDLKLSRVIL